MIGYGVLGRPFDVLYGREPRPLVAVQKSEGQPLGLPHLTVLDSLHAVTNVNAPKREQYLHTLMNNELRVPAVRPAAVRDVRRLQEFPKCVLHLAQGNFDIPPNNC